MIDKSKVTKQLVETSQKLLEELKKLEPSENEVAASHTFTQKLVFESTDFSLSSSHESSHYGLRTISQGKTGFVTSNSLDDTKLRAMAREAQMMGRLSQASPYNQITKIPARGHFEAFDPQLAEVPARQIQQWAESVVEEAKKDSRISIDRAELILNLTVWTLCNSHGVELSAAQTSCDWFVMGMGKTPDEVTSFDYDGGTVWEKKSVESEIEKSISRFRESVVNSLGSQKGQSYKGPVLLHPYAVLDLIGDVIGANCNGVAHADGVSPWTGKMDEAVVSQMLNVVEDPLDKNRISGWVPFDREGVLASRHSVIHEGRLKFVAHNHFSANRLGTVSTGNAVGGVGSLPRVGFGNLSIGPSALAKTYSDTELMGLLKNGLVLKRFSGNSDPYSGAFSGVAKNSWRVRDGEFAGPVQEVMVAGNLFDIMKQVLAVGSLQHVLMGNALAPYILVDGITVTAG